MISWKNIRTMLLEWTQKERLPSAAEWQRLVPLLNEARWPLPDASWTLDQWEDLLARVEARQGSTLADHDLGLTTEDRAEALGVVMPVSLVADRLRSAFNVGSILRSMEFYGAGPFVGIGFTPLPDHPLVKKTALGAEPAQGVQSFATLSEAIVFLKSNGIEVVALETCERAVSLEAWQPKFPLAIIFGHERKGVSVDDLASCDTVVSIPGHGRKNSLNVGVTAGIVLQRVRTAWDAR